MSCRFCNKTRAIFRRVVQTLTGEPPRPLTRANVLEEARSWIGTSWEHQHHLKGVHCDCIGLIVETARRCGAAEGFVYPPYDRHPHGGQLRRELEKYVEKVPQAAMLPGDILLCAWNVEPMHLAFLGNYLHKGVNPPYSLIHAMMLPGYVVEHYLSPTWEKRIVGVYRLRGIQN